MLRKDRTWRRQIVKVGLCHLLISLLSLLAAFTFAGCMLAAVDAEPCDLVPCEYTGVPCSTFAPVNNKGAGLRRQGPRALRTLSPELVRLNNATFGDVAHGAVTCQDYSYIASYSRVAHEYPKQFAAGVLAASWEGGQAQKPSMVGQPCLVALSEFVFANRSLIRSRDHYLSCDRVALPVRPGPRPTGSGARHTLLPRLAPPASERHGNNTRRCSCGRARSMRAPQGPISLFWE